MAKNGGSGGRAVGRGSRAANGVRLPSISGAAAAVRQRYRIEPSINGLNRFAVIDTARSTSSSRGVVVRQNLTRREAQAFVRSRVRTATTRVANERANIIRTATIDRQLGLF